jgi:putative flippase GtrA
VKKAAEIARKVMLRRTDNVLVQLFRYFAVSGLSLVLDFATLYLFTDVLGIHYMVSGVMSYSIGLVVNYASPLEGVRLEEVRRQAKGVRHLRLIGVAGMGVNSFVLWLCTGLLGMHYLVARVISAAIGYAWNSSPGASSFSRDSVGDQSHAKELNRAQ